jgi:hypothetical protein
MKVLATAIILPSVTAAMPALAQDNKPPAICWEILSPAQGVSPHSVLKVNKCTGETWILTRTRLSDSKGTAPASYTFRWRPLLHDEGEAVLTNR